VGLVYDDAAGAPHPTWALAPDFQGCGYLEPDHTWEGGRIEYNDGACDGWLLASDLFSIGYYYADFSQVSDDDVRRILRRHALIEA